MPRQQRKIGMVVRIPLDGEQDGFGQALARPEFVVLDLFKSRGEAPTAHELQDANPLFRIWVMSKAITSGRWSRLGVFPLRDAFQRPIQRFKIDPISGKYALCMNDTQRLASPEECRGLEPAAIWSAEHVEARLLDHLLGRPHKPLQRIMVGAQRADEIDPD